ncbi:MAG: nucleotidyltransferase domain-containing protein [bacterium]
MDRAADIWTEHSNGLIAFCAKWGISELALFGSVLREDFRPESDIDVLVRFGEHHPWSVSDHLAMEAELSDLVGRRVEITSRRALEESHNWIRRSEIFGTARTLYAA